MASCVICTWKAYGRVWSAVNPLLELEPERNRNWNRSEMPLTHSCVAGSAFNFTLLIETGTGTGTGGLG